MDPPASANSGSGKAPPPTTTTTTMTTTTKTTVATAKTAATTVVVATAAPTPAAAAPPPPTTTTTTTTATTTAATTTAATTATETATPEGRTEATTATTATATTATETTATETTATATTATRPASVPTTVAPKAATTTTTSQNNAEATWEKCFNRFRSYENCLERVPLRLRQWAQDQRLEYENGKMSTHRVAQLNSIGFFQLSLAEEKLLFASSKATATTAPTANAAASPSSTKPSLLPYETQAWEGWFSCLYQHVAQQQQQQQQKGHTTGSTQWLVLPPNLQQWFEHQRIAHRCGQLSVNRVRKLESLLGQGCWTPAAAPTGSRPMLGTMAATANASSPFRFGLPAVSQLDVREIVQESPAKGRKWLAMYQELQIFFQIHGHTRVPVHFDTAAVHRRGTARLGSWVQTQKRDHRFQRLAPARARLLDLLSLPWLPPLNKNQNGNQSLSPANHKKKETKRQTKASAAKVDPNAIHPQGDDSITKQNSNNNTHRIKVDPPPGSSQNEQSQIHHHQPSHNNNPVEHSVPPSRKRSRDERPHPVGHDEDDNSRPAKQPTRDASPQLKQPVAVEDLVNPPSKQPSRDASPQPKQPVGDDDDDSRPAKQPTPDASPQPKQPVGDDDNLQGPAPKERDKNAQPTHPIGDDDDNPQRKQPKEDQTPQRPETPQQTHPPVDDTAGDKEEEPLYSTWLNMYQELQAYYSVHGNSDIPSRFVSPPEHKRGKAKLGFWVASQRALKKRKRLSSAKIKLLEKVEMRWLPKAKVDHSPEDNDIKEGITSPWRIMYEKLRRYQAKHGHCQVPRPQPNGDRSNVSELGDWVSLQQRLFQAGVLSKERMRLLSKLDFGQSLPAATDNTKRTPRGSSKANAEGTPKANAEGATNANAKGTPKANTNATQTQTTGLLPDNPEELVLLVSKDPNGAKWLRTYRELKIFHSQNGHSRVPRSYIGSSGAQRGAAKLGSWVATQRHLHASKRMSRARIRLLDHLDFWDRSGEMVWVGATIDVDATGGQRTVWIGELLRVDDAAPKKKSRKVDLPDDPAVELHRIAGSGVPGQVWIQGYEELLRFVMKHGHCRVPAGYHPAGHAINLGRWIESQRKRYRGEAGFQPLSKDELFLLNEVEFAWNEKREKAK